MVLTALTVIVVVLVPVPVRAKVVAAYVAVAGAGMIALPATTAGGESNGRSAINDTRVLSRDRRLGYVQVSASTITCAWYITHRRGVAKARTDPLPRQGP